MKKYISVILASVMTLSMHAFAAELNISQSGNAVTVSISGAVRDAQIAVIVENSDKEIRFLDDNYADENGKYSVTYNLSGDDGVFDVTAYVGGGQTVNGTFMVRSRQIEEELINTLRQQAASASPDAAALKQLTEKYRMALDLNEELYGTLADRDGVFAKMTGDRDNAYVTGFDDFRNAFYRAVAMEKYSELANKGDICTILTASPYVESFGEDGAFFAARMKAIVKNAVPYITDGMDSDYDGAKDFIGDMQFSLLRAAISKSPVWTDVKKIAEAYKDKIGISENVSNDKYKAIIGNNYNSYTEVKEALSPSENGSPGGGGGKGSKGNKGGSASGGGSGMITTPVNPLPQTSEPTVKQGKSVFTDMDGFKWADEAVTAIFELGIVSGDGNGCFAPERTVSRAEAAKMLVLLMKKDVSNTKYIPFNDVEREHWSYPYISAAYADGIINGKSTDLFDGESGVTRQEMAIMAWNAMRSMGFTDNGREVFADSGEIADWASDAVEILGSYGVVNGRKTEKGYAFAPNEYINRAEAAMMIYNISKLLS